MKSKGALAVIRTMNLRSRTTIQYAMAFGLSNITTSHITSLFLDGIIISEARKVQGLMFIAYIVDSTGVFERVIVYL